MEVAASAIAIITLVGNVSNICLRLYGSLGAKEELNQIVKEMEGLRHILTVIAQLTASDTSYAQVCSKSNLAKVIKECEEEIKDLEAALKKVEDSRLPGLSLPWLLKEKALTRRLDKLSRLKQDLQLSMQTDQTSLNLSAKKEDEVFRSSVAEKEREHQRRQIIDWLDPAAFSSACDDAQKTRCADTFTWLLEGQSIAAWRDSPHLSIWLHGIPGCGKTVFASSVVEVLTPLCQQDQNRTLAYFFFEFASRAKGNANSFLRSILAQIVAQRKGVPIAVQTLYTENHEGVRGPNERKLFETLRAILEDSRDVYIIVDAIDECESRAGMLDILRRLQLERISSLHLMVTSRTEADCEEALQAFHQVSLVGSEHNHDIRKYITQRMLDERTWMKWSTEVQAEIASVVLAKAEDMFRLAKLHLDALQKCKTRQALQQTMRKLPSTLDDTYARILASIDTDVRSDALRILCWLCFALRPPTLPELAATLAVNLDTLEYDPMMIYQDPNEVFGICGSLLKRSEEDGRPVVKLSHASVKDYLVSGRSPLDFYKLSLDSSWAHEQICTICLVYLNAHNYDSVDQIRFQNDPLVSYATSFWTEHFRRAGQCPPLLEQALNLLLGESVRYFKWAWIGAFLPTGFHVEQLVDDPEDLQTRLNSSLYLSALVGSIELINGMVEKGAQVNGRSGSYESALAAATIMGNLSAVKHLLDLGADVDSKAGFYGRVLHAAAASGWIEVVDHLLSSGADIVAFEGIHMTVLLAAMGSGPKRIPMVERLLRAGADPSDGSGPETPLNYATSEKDIAMLELLINSGANLNDGSLQSSLGTGDLNLANVLIDAGADPHAINARTGSSVGAAATHSVTALRFLIEERNISFDMVDQEGRNALHLAASVDNVASVQYLLDIGFQANSKDKKGWSAVHYAASTRTTDCLKLLLPSWTLDSCGWTPLHLACRANTIESIDLLLEAGLRPTSIRTEQPEWNWTLFDIAVWHMNDNLVSADCRSLHPSLRNSDPPIFRDFPMGTSSSLQWRFCDGCQPGRNFVSMYMPLFHCKQCPDFDYCMVCMETAAKTHPHSTWELLPYSQTDLDLLKSKRMTMIRPRSLYSNPLQESLSGWINLL